MRFLLGEAVTASCEGSLSSVALALPPILNGFLSFLGVMAISVCWEAGGTDSLVIRAMSGLAPTIAPSGNGVGDEDILCGLPPMRKLLALGLVADGAAATGEERWSGDEDLCRTDCEMSWDLF